MVAGDERPQSVHRLAVAGEAEAVLSEGDLEG